MLLMLACSFSVLAGEEEKATCRELRYFLENSVGDIDCLDQYHHYNAHAKSIYYSSKKALSQKEVKIGSFNLYNLGSTRTEFKDNALVAKIVNRWDVVAVQELMPVIGRDLRHNEALTELYKSLKIKLADMTTNGASYSERKKLKDELELLKSQYEVPGYIPLLKELQKVDPSWSLILAGTEEGTDTSTVFELAGYFYRASVVRPIKNEYCEKYQGGSKSYACTPKFEKEFYGSNVAELFARRPFVGSFESANFDFTLVNTHIIHNAPSDETLRKKILKAAFGVEDHSEIGYGVSSRTFARFAEVKHIINFMEKYRKQFKEQDLILLGDFNIEADEEYWNILLKDAPGMEVHIKDKTSISLKRVLASGTETNGVKNNYDHFVYNSKVTQACSPDNAKVFNFLENSFQKIIDNKYLIRSNQTYEDEETKKTRYYLAGSANYTMNEIMGPFLNYIDGKYTVSRGKIVKRFDREEKKKDLERKVFEPQLHDRSYYRHYREIISDHLPIYVNCSNKYDHD